MLNVSTYDKKNQLRTILIIMDIRVNGGTWVLQKGPGGTTTWSCPTDKLVMNNGWNTFNPCHNAVMVSRIIDQPGRFKNVGQNMGKFFNKFKICDCYRSRQMPYGNLITNFTPLRSNPIS